MHPLKLDRNCEKGIIRTQDLYRCYFKAYPVTTMTKGPMLFGIPLREIALPMSLRAFIREDRGAM